MLNGDSGIALGGSQPGAHKALLKLGCKYIVHSCLITAKNDFIKDNLRHIYKYKMALTMFHP